MRRKEREIIDFEKMVHFLDRCDCCRLGLSDGETPYIVPLNFGWVAENGLLTLYFHCAAEGKKLDLIRKNRIVSFEADCLHEPVTGDTACRYSFRYACIMGQGMIRTASTVDEKRKGLTAVMAHYAPDYTPVFSEKQIGCVTVLILEVSEWTCKANL